MSTFNFSFHKCCSCGNLTDDGGFVNGFWFCLECLEISDFIYSDISF